MYQQPEKYLLDINTSSTCPDNMVNFGLLTAEICWRVWGNPANFNGFRVLAVLLYGTLVVGVGQTLQRWTEGATYIRQGGHHVGHWPTFLVYVCFVTETVLTPPSWVRQCVWGRQPQQGSPKGANHWKKIVGNIICLNVELLIENQHYINQPIFITDVQLH